MKYSADNYSYFVFCFFSSFFPLNLGSLYITDKHQSPRFKSVTESIPGKRGKATNLSSVIKFYNLSLSLFSFFSFFFFWYFCTIIHSACGTVPDLRLLILLCVHGCGLYFLSKDSQVELAMPKSAHAAVSSAQALRGLRLAIFGSGQEGAS